MPASQARGISAFFRDAPRWEVVLVCALFVLVMALKLAYVPGLRIDSDEPQHLHVVWGWTQGQVQYRDYFDNHAPLFQLLVAPVMKGLGERADILFWMRLVMVPFFAASLYCLGVLGRRLFRAGLTHWAVLIAAVFPVFLMTSTEFRTDNLWMLGWFAFLAVFFGGELTLRRWFVSGLLLGATFSASMKTSLLLVSLLMGALPVLLWRGRREGFGFLKGIGPRLGVALAGAMVLPAVLLLFFAAQGALGDLYYCVFQHNMIAGHGRQLHWTFLGRVGLSAGFGALIYALSPSHSVAARRTTLFVSANLYLGLLHGYWPLITDQDYLPVVPVLILVSVLSGVEAALKLPFLASRRWVPKVACLIAVLGVGWSTISERNPFEVNHARLFEEGLEHLLKLAGPGDYLMDPKGETIFRKRPFYYVLEGVTHRRIKNGLLKDTVREDVVRTNTCVIFFNKRIPRRHRKWLQAEYVQVAHEIWVAGATVPAPAGSGERRFSVARPALYRVMNAEGPVAAVIDGRPCDGAVHLEPGEHVIEGSGELAVVWAKTHDAGLNPFTTQELVCTLVNDQL